VCEGHLKSTISAISDKQYTIINYSHHTIYWIPGTCLSL
jgi:hypothetical protein